MSDPVVLLSTGDVVGPAGGVTDNSMVLFSGTSGKLIKGNNAVVTAAGLALLDDVDAAAQRTTLGLKTGAVTDKTTSTTDPTVGRLTKVGDFGVGGRLDLRDTIFVTGKPQDIYAKGFVKGFADGGPAGLAIPGIVGVAYGVLELNAHWNESSGAGGIMRSFTRGSSCVVYTQTMLSATAWSSWVATWNTGNLVKTASATDTTAGSMLKVGDFGLGSVSVPTVANLNNYTTTGFFGYYADSGSTGGPAGLIYGGVQVQSNFSGSCSQIFRQHYSQRVFYRTTADGGVSWQPWVEVWTTSNLVKTTSATDTTAGSVLKVGDFGVGTPIPTTNLNTLTGTGLFTCGDVTGTPGASILGWWVYQIDAGAGVWKNQTAWPQGSAGFQYARTSGDGTTWGAWIPVVFNNSPAFTGTPTAPTASAGTNTTQLANTAFVKTAIDNANILKSIGIDQTWQNVAASRVLGTTYTNSTGRPIAISFVPANSSNKTHSLTIDGSVIASLEYGTATVKSQLFGIVPPWGTYKVNSTSTIETWMELR